VPTPRALELRERVGRIVEDGAAVLRPAERLDLTRLDRTFTLRTSEGFVENFGPALVASAAAGAPGVRLRFVQKPDKESTPLREGAVDLETGVVEPTTGPELRARALFEDRLVGVVRAGHPLADGAIAAARYAAGRHVNVSRRGAERGEVDEALDALGLARRVAAIVDGFASALALARGSDLIAAVPERHTGVLRAGMHTFPLRSRRRASRYRCSGTRGCTPTRRTAGCAASCWRRAGRRADPVSRAWRRAHECRAGDARSATSGDAPV
jgi:DNA-binding transcriptional LysR family regulator